jgi:hypothetical protein
LVGITSLQGSPEHEGSNYKEGEEQKNGFNPKSFLNMHSKSTRKYMTML